MEFKQFRQSCTIIRVLKFWCFASSCHDTSYTFIALTFEGRRTSCTVWVIPHLDTTFMCSVALYACVLAEFTTSNKFHIDQIPNEVPTMNSLNKSFGFISIKAQINLLGGKICAKQFNAGNLFYSTTLPLLASRFSRVRNEILNVYDPIQDSSLPPCFFSLTASFGTLNQYLNQSATKVVLGEYLGYR